MQNRKYNKQIAEAPNWYKLHEKYTAGGTRKYKRVKRRHLHAKSSKIGGN